MQMTFDLSDPVERQSVAELIRVLDSDETPLGEPRAGGTGDSFLETFLRNVGTGSWYLIELAAKHYASGQEFTFEDLAQKAGVPVSELKAYHRNLARTAISLGGKIEQILPARWDGTRQHYTLTPELYAATTS
jgi:hypothetical protein